MKGFELFISILVFALGIALSELTHVGVWVPVSLTCFILGVVTAFLVFHKKFLLFLLIVSLSLFAGIGREKAYSYFHNHEGPLGSFVNKKVTLVGVLSEEQERRDYNTRLTVKVGELEGLHLERAVKILVTTTSPKDFRYGDVVKIRGVLSKPENFYTDTGREFDYIGYLDSHDVKFLVKNATVEKNGSEPPSRVIAVLFAIKRAFVRALGRMLPEPQSSLAAGILIDGKQSINGELQEKFRRTGLVHIVVLSGYNVSIVAEAIGKMCVVLPRILGFSFAGIGILAFAVITGASATVVRASIMALIVLASRFFIRKYDPARGLFVASLLMLVHNPTILLHSPSFQLSFLATFVVVKIVPRVGEWFSWVRFLPERFGLRDLVVSNITVQLFLLPILTWMTGFVSAVSLPVNMLVLPLIPFTMLMSFLTGLTGLVSSLFAMPFAFVSHSLLSYELAIVEFFSKMSLAEISLNIFSGWFVAIFYSFTILWFAVVKASVRMNVQN